ncbi:MAG: HEAT repeat domain-containing protein [Pseudobdellovibrio sp.]
MKNILLSMCLTIGCFSAPTYAAIAEKELLGFTDQLSRAKNTALPMTHRWEALIKASELADGKEIKQVLEFAEHKDWFMRNALLVALDKMGTDLVYEKAKLMVSDKALVVRSAAVDILTRLENYETRQLLIKELNKEYNFVGKKSLWIRSQIMKNLVKKPNSTEKQLFAKLLFDQDKEISSMSIMALEKINNIKFEEGKKAELWKKYVKDQRWL